jgi:hypothetical protein
MNCEAVRHVFENSKQKGNAFTMLLTLAYLSDENGVCDSSLAELSEHARMNRRSTQTALTRLKKAGEITIEVHKGRKTQSGYTNKHIIQGVSNLSSLEAKAVIDQSSLGNKGVSNLSPLNGASGDRNSAPSAQGVSNLSRNPSTSTVEECKLLIAAWENAHPDGKRPRYTNTQENLKIAAELVAEGFAVAEVARLTADKWVGGRQTDYKFRFLAEDIRLQRASKPKKPAMFKPDPELDREYTPEEIAERVRLFEEARIKVGYVRKDKQHVA